MKKQYLIGIAALAVLIIGFVSGCFCCCGKNKTAVVNVPLIVSKSAQVDNLKEQQALRTQELQKWLAQVQSEVNKEKDKKKQEELLKQYNIEFAKKKAEINENYNNELRNIDKSITETISKVAKEKGYKMVVAKAYVITGGDDITEEIIKVVK